MCVYMHALGMYNEKLQHASSKTWNTEQYGLILRCDCIEIEEVGLFVAASWLACIRDEQNGHTAKSF